MWYLTITSARNRLKSQAARLRQPRYLVALVLGIAYLYWALGAGMRDEEMPFSQLAAKPQVPLIVSAVLLLTPRDGGWPAPIARRWRSPPPKCICSSLHPSHAAPSCTRSCCAARQRSCSTW
jgi:hypothetical protein